MKTIVALVDFSDVSSKVLQQVQTLAQSFKSHVTVLHGMPKMPPVVVLEAPGIFEESAETVRADLARLETLTEPLRAAGVDVSLKQLRDATAESIVEETLRLGADLIVVGSHQHNAFYNLLVGSVTNTILMRTECPVVVVPMD